VRFFVASVQVVFIKIIDALATLNMTFNNNRANFSVRHVLSCNFYIIYIIIFTDYSEIKL